MKKFNISNLMLLSGALMLLLVSQQSCVKDHFNFDKLEKTADYSPAVAGAIAHTKLTLRDIIRDYDKNELFEEDADGFLYLMYNKTVYSVQADEFISLPNQTFNLSPSPYTQTVYNSIAPVSGYRTFPQADEYYNFIVSNQEQLDSIAYDALQIKISVNSSFHLNGILEITFPTLKKNGTPFTTIVYPDNSGSFSYSLNTLIEGYTLEFDINQVLVSFNLKLQDGTANAGEKLDISLQINDQDFSAIYGYVGTHNIDIPKDTVHIDIFDNAFHGEMYFENPSLKLSMANYMGIPVAVAFDSLYTYSLITQTFNGYDYPGANPLDINRPTTPGDFALTVETFTPANFPELRTIVSESPKYIFFDVSGFINPNGYETTPANFVLDTSRFNVNMELKLPLLGNAWYSLVDTLELNIEGNYADISKHFVSANLRTVFDNFLPTDAYAQVIFTDSLYHPIDTLYIHDVQNGERLIESAILNAEGRAVQPVKKINDILFGNGPEYEHNIEVLDHVKYAIVIATLMTNQNASVGQGAPLVKFFSDNYLEVRFGLQGQGKYNEVVQ